MRILSHIFRRLSAQLIFATAMASLIAPHPTAWAQAAEAGYPAKPVRFVVPFAPGGSADQLARPIAKKLQELWGQPVIVDNRGGAGGMIGTDAVAKAAPDGYTIGLVVGGHTINPSIHKTMLFDTTKDLVGVTQLTSQQMVLVAHPSMPFNTLPELIQYAKKNPGRVTYGSSGVGVATHLAIELLSQQAGVKLTHAPYKGTTPAYTDLLGGQISLICDVTSSAMPYVEAGRLKVIALTGATRAPKYRQYPVVAETIPGFNLMSMFGVVTTAGTPRPVVDKVQRDLAAVLRTPEMKKLLQDGGMDAVASTPAQFDQHIASEIARWSEVIKRANIEIEK